MAKELIWIVIHRRLVADIKFVFQEMREKLGSLVDDLKVDEHRCRLETGRVMIDFRCGEPWRLAGLYTDMFNACELEAIMYLKMAASRRDGCTTNLSLDDIYEFIMELRQKERRACMNIEQCITIDLSEQYLKEIVLDFVRKRGYETDIKNINFDVGTTLRGYGRGEYEETVLRGCKVKCSGLVKKQYE